MNKEIKQKRVERLVQELFDGIVELINFDMEHIKSNTLFQVMGKDEDLSKKINEALHDFLDNINKYLEGDESKEIIDALYRDAIYLRIFKFLTNSNNNVSKLKEQMMGLEITLDDLHKENQGLREQVRKYEEMLTAKNVNFRAVS